jgi:hypothetical protein
MAALAWDQVGERLYETGVDHGVLYPIDGTGAYTPGVVWNGLTAVPHPGVRVGQQGRKVFGLSYRTRLGDDIEGTDHGFRLHLVWGAQAAPSEKAYATINDSPSAIDFSWDISTTPVPVVGHSELKPTSLMVIDSTVVDPTDLTTLMDALYGTSGTAHLPLPGAVVDMFTTGP